MKLALNKNEFVRMGMAIQFPTFFNDFESIPGGTNIDSYLELLYGVEPNYGGFCNEPDLGFPNWCLTRRRLRPARAARRFRTSRPASRSTSSPSVVASCSVPENPLAYNEDISFSDWASELALCLPRTSPGGPLPNVTEDWIVRTMSSPAYDPAGTFQYQVQVKNEYGCNFETEPNNDFPQANPIVLGETYHGIIQDVRVLGTARTGLLRPRSGPVQLRRRPRSRSSSSRPTGYDLYAVDTGLELYVGPDDSASTTSPASRTTTRSAGGPTSARSFRRRTPCWATCTRMRTTS